MKLQEKLVEIQKNLKAPKSQYNSFGKYHYRNAEDILNAVKPLLGECTLTLEDEMVYVGNETNGRFYVKATATLNSGEEKEEVSAYAREEENKKGMDGSQITGAASSYARKYALNGLFAIDDTKDSDHTNTGNVPVISDELRKKVEDAPTLDALKEIWEANKGLGKEFVKLVTDQKEFIKNADKEIQPDETA